MNNNVSQPLTLGWLFFSFQGRIARQSYIFSIIFVTLLFSLVIYQIVKAGEDQDRLAFWGLAFIGLAAASFWSGLALSVKRLHDLDLPWQLVVLQFIPLIVWLFIGYLMIMPSKPVTNKHGPPPFGPKQSD